MSNPKMTDDRALVTGVIRGEEQALRALIKQHERLVAHMIGRLVKQEEDREELCQDVFLRVFEKIKEFNFQSRLSTWIATIAWHCTINHMRKRKMEYTDLPEDEAWTSRFIEMENPGSMLAEQDMEEWILKLIHMLPSQYKVVLTLYHLDGMNYSEIGEATGMPEGTVKNYLFRARNLLKDKVKKYLSKEEND